MGDNEAEHSIRGSHTLESLRKSYSSQFADSVFIADSSSLMMLVSLFAVSYFSISSYNFDVCSCMLSRSIELSILSTTVDSLINFGRELPSDLPFMVIRPVVLSLIATLKGFDLISSVTGKYLNFFVPPVFGKNPLKLIVNKFEFDVETDNW